MQPLLVLTIGTPGYGLGPPVKPGQSLHCTATATIAGVLTTLGTLPTVTLIGPQGTTLTPTAVLDSQGTYHADTELPANAERGLWVERWQATGGSPSANATSEQLFDVAPLGTG